VALRWKRAGERIRYRVSVPGGYSVTVENLSGQELIPETT